MNQDDIKARVERARELDREASQGPWTASQGAVDGIISGPDFVFTIDGNEHARSWADSRFIAESRTLLPALAADCERLQGERQAALDVARIAEQNRDWALLRLNRDAARLADEVDVLVRRKVIDHRSPAADALLDFREPPSTERSCRLAELEQARDREKEREESLREQLAAAHRTIADDAALLAIAKDFARNAAPILNAHKQLVAAAQKGDEAEKNRIVTVMALLETT